MNNTYKTYYCYHAYTVFIEFFLLVNCYTISGIKTAASI